MFAVLGLGGGELILLLVFGLVVLGVLAAGVGLILYFALRKKEPEQSGPTPLAVPPKA